MPEVAVRSVQASTETLCEKFGMTEATLAQRRRFVGLDDSDRERLQSLVPWAQEVAPALAREFYEFQFSFPPTAAFFEEQAKRKGVSLDQLREYLEAAQAGYFVEIFEGARDGWDSTYFARRLHVGRVHDLIDLPMKWYIGSYSTYQRLTRKFLRKSFRRAAVRESAEESIFKVFNLDMQAVADAYQLSFLNSMGVRLESIDVGQDRDRSECMGAVKASVGDLIRDIMQSSDQLAGAASELSRVSEEMNQSSSAVAAASEELSASIGEISQQTCNASEIADTAVRSTENAAAEISKFKDAGDEIENVIRLITSIAEQTHLLALNATIEAARAGEKGKGFAVVAGEVKELANATTRATEEIGERISGIQHHVQTTAGNVEEVRGVTHKIHDLGMAVASAVEEQSSVVGEISRSAQVSSSMASGTRKSAEELSGLAARLKELTASFHV